MFAGISSGETRLSILYLSLANITYVMLGFFSGNFEGIYGAILYAISHGIVFFILFILLEFLSKRGCFRNEEYFALVKQTPVFAGLFTFAIFTLSSMPGTGIFIGKFLSLAGLWKISKFYCLLASLCILLTLVLLLLLYTKVLFSKLVDKSEHKQQDLTFAEISISSMCIIFVLVLGIYPDIVGDIIREQITSFVNSIKIYR
jgi:NADH-quinone oxidoreductase subunit M